MRVFRRKPGPAYYSLDSNHTRYIHVSQDTSPGKFVSGNLMAYLKIVSYHLAAFESTLGNHLVGEMSDDSYSNLKKCKLPSELPFNSKYFFFQFALQRYFFSDNLSQHHFFTKTFF